ncbi:MAG: hypothetical protein JRI23_12120 [Deltaproteobacteria bacterium]|nr:hypothetical protein [Deltaproteobacteria bacterium]MBW2532455.1 hypothetical protein [Deltaproteobacteria bacterium]
MRSLSPIQVASFAAALLASGPTRAEPAEEPAEPEYTPEEGLPHPPAADLRSGHLLIAAGGGVWVPSVGLLPTTEETGSFSVGGGLRAALGIGLTRHVVLRVDGGAAWFDGTSACDSCQAQSIDVGLGLAYVLAQGIAFEPWAGYGMGYRYASFETGTAEATAHGFDVARLSLGGDFFPLPSLGFGPFIETDIGVTVDPDTAGYVGFLAGLRIAYDPMRTGTEITSTVAGR